MQRRKSRLRRVTCKARFSSALRIPVSVPSSKADAQRITEKVGMPLEMAVDLLKDIDGRIALSLPITGRVSDPDVDFGPAINKAIGNVL